ncbi:hypothetical protein [Nocardia terpenica]|uniref:Uncharacterized protein n=1 Tax=Nocardia terpenica TaxID=455432 RepID=A0A6G9Z079_9NOCA|nr:hypothetical protein [Nocardia terpenica]QIS18767.1 hypothetical protein F6W96_11160 [Nocardia terpenica]
MPDRQVRGSVAAGLVLEYIRGLGLLIGGAESAALCRRRMSAEQQKDGP